MMKLTNTGIDKRVIIHPGEQCVSSTPVVLSTILGSCISCCLYDDKNKVFGMNHFLLSEPSINNVIESEAGRYGIHAMELLINGIMKKGGNRDLLKAKCFGGSDILGLRSAKDNNNVGSKNIKFIETFFEQENIPVVSSDMGGHHGRTIHFFGHDFSVYLKRSSSLSKEARLRAVEEKYIASISARSVASPQKVEYW